MRVNRRSSNEAAKGMAISGVGQMGKSCKCRHKSGTRLVVDALSIKLKKCYQGTFCLLPPSRFLILVL